MVKKTVATLALLTSLMLSGCLQAGEETPQSLDAADEDADEAGSDPFEVTTRWKGTTSANTCARADPYMVCMDPATDSECCSKHAVPEAAGNATLVLSWDDPADRALTVHARGDGVEAEDGLRDSGASPLTVHLPLASGSERTVSLRVVQDFTSTGPVTADTAVDFEAVLTFTA